MRSGSIPSPLIAEQIRALAEQTEFLPYVIGNTFTFDRENPTDIAVPFDANEYTLSEIEIGRANLQRMITLLTDLL